MKVLFDCIATSTPSKCSTSFQFYTLSQDLLASRPDIFIYWVIPSDLEEEEYEFYPKDERIHYIKVHQYVDRLKEYNRLSDEMQDILYAGGLYWDWDVCITVRTLQVPLMRIIASHMRSSLRRKIILIENMMMVKEKPTVNLADVDTQERMIIEAYLAADSVYFPAYHLKPYALRVCRDWFSFDVQRKIRDKIKEVSYLQLTKYDYKLKTDTRYDKRGGKFGLAYSGRMQATGSQLDLTNEVICNSFITTSDKIYPFVVTVSSGGKAVDAVIEMNQPTREEFWRKCREEMDLVLHLSIDLEINMSKLEPILFGVPAIAYKAKWSVAMLGEDYPFFANSRVEILGLIKHIMENYEDCYAQFSKWYDDWFIPTYLEREENGFFTSIVKDVLATEQASTTEFNEGSILHDLMDYGDEIVFSEAAKELSDSKVISKSVAAKLNKWDFKTRGLVWQTDWQNFRYAMLGSHGYKDASVTVGHLIKDTKND